MIQSERKRLKDLSIGFFLNYQKVFVKQFFEGVKGYYGSLSKVEEDIGSSSVFQVLKNHYNNPYVDFEINPLLHAVTGKNIDPKSNWVINEEMVDPRLLAEEYAYVWVLKNEGLSFDLNDHLRRAKVSEDVINRMQNINVNFDYFDKILENNTLSEWIMYSTMFELCFNPLFSAAVRKIIWDNVGSEENQLQFLKGVVKCVFHTIYFTDSDVYNIKQETAQNNMAEAAEVLLNVSNGKDFVEDMLREAKEIEDNSFQGLLKHLESNVEPKQSEDVPDVSNEELQDVFLDYSSESEIQKEIAAFEKDIKNVSKRIKEVDVELNNQMGQLKRHIAEHNQSILNAIDQFKKKEKESLELIEKLQNEKNNLRKEMVNMEYVYEKLKKGLQYEELREDLITNVSIKEKES